MPETWEHSPSARRVSAFGGYLTPKLAVHYGGMAERLEVLGWDERVAAAFAPYAARGLEPAMAYYFLLDRTARGRQEEGEGEHWLRRHDEYDI